MSTEELEELERPAGELVLITLDDDELAEALHHAIDVFAYVRRHVIKRHRHGQRSERHLEDEIAGALAEAAASQWSGYPYRRELGGDQGRPDVGPFEVRARYSQWDRLIVREPIPAERLYLAVHRVGHRWWQWQIVGYCTGTEAKRYPLETYNERPNARWVPYRHLHHPSEWRP